ncbi:asparagine synthase B [Thermoleophilia bacterium SCSIO 60948]|nr:asparagine synthase B [Thermoleophilia bacterium SCSIO 60948]
MRSGRSENPWVSGVSVCGIAAQHGSPDPIDGERMLEAMISRGPDDQGSVGPDDGLEGAWLGHRRLSIVDVEGGHQPLVGAGGDVFMVGNGEIYNHEAIRERLPDHVFRTRSDNEVALHLIERDGPKALADLNGMYAFCLAGRDGRFLAARDPIGIKPLYWATKNGRTVLGSEMASFAPELRDEIHAFPPGHYWTPEEGLVRFAAPVPPDAVADSSRREPAEPTREDLDELREVIVDAVERQMMGDVPVGVFLSGGLDSSLVAAIAQNYLERRGMTLQTFAVGLEGSPDVLAARACAEALGTEHREHLYTAEEATASMPEVIAKIEAYDPALVRSAVPNLMLAKFTSQYVKVVLTGEGADELFAGYEYMVEFPDPEPLHAELVRNVEGLHNLNLQRCDRVTMAHSLEARVPFLDAEVVAHVMRLPASWKVYGKDVPEKRLLRAAFEGWLPDELLWRDKSQFGDGSGAASVLTDPFTDSVTQADFEAECASVEPPLRTREEVAYYRIFREHLGDVQPSQTLGRFATA